MESKEYKIEFMKYWKNFLIFSAVLIVCSWGIIGFKGLKYGIDFAGGTSVLLKFNKEVTVNSVRQTARTVNSSAEVQTFGTEGSFEYLISMQNSEKESGDKESKALISKFETTLGAENVVTLKVESVGAKIGSEFKENGIYALLLSFLVILAYIAFRFHINFSPGAVICLIHDVSITVGIFCLIGKEFNLSTVAALLTIVGYSLNDTIVVYDRIREIMNKYSKNKSIEDILNLGINQTLSRTMLTSVTTLATTLCLYFLGSGLIKDFALALSIGVIVGTYSSIYIASPFIIIYGMFFEKSKHA